MPPESTNQSTTDQGKPVRLKFIGCEIIYREACLLAARSRNMIDLEFLHKGLHDLETADMVTELQQAVDRADADGGYEAVLLGYARCNDGAVGLRARTSPLVIPKAHDCITFFFGSRGAYKEHFDSCPGTYYLTTGWLERGDSSDERSMPAHSKRSVMAQLGLTDSYEQLVAKHGKDNADYIIETLGGWQKHYSKCLFLRMGVCDERPFIEQARRRAESNNWTFECRDGDLSLLEKLFSGQWDDDFVVVEPGAEITARNDDDVLGVSPE